MGREAAAEAFAYGWEHWNRIGPMDNPTGYIYRVGQRLADRWSRIARVPLFGQTESAEPQFEPGLGPALERLSARQRVTVVLVTALGYTHREAADFQGISTSSVQRHLERALRHLRSELGVRD